MKHGDTIASPLWVGFDGRSLPASLSRWLAGGQVSGVVLYSRNIESPAQVRGLCREIRSAAGRGNPLPLIAVDQDGGRVARFKDPPFTWFPPARACSLFCCRNEAVAVAAPTASATASLRPQQREQARAGGNQVNGGSLNRATRPPSWSTAINGRGLPRPAADRISRHNSRTWAGVSMLREKRTIPLTCPSASHRDGEGGSDFPSKPIHRGEAMVSPCFIAWNFSMGLGSRSRRGLS